MKKISILFLVMALSISSLNAQSIKDVVKDFQKNNKEYSIVIPGFLLKIALAYGDMEKEEREVLKQIDKMKVMVSKNAYKGKSFEILEDGIKKGNLKELVTINDGNEKVRMIMNKASGKKQEMLMLVKNPTESVLMLVKFKGEPDFSKFVALAKM